MVTDSLQNLEQYRGLHKNMDTVIDFLKKCDLTALPCLLYTSPSPRDS